MPKLSLPLTVPPSLSLALCLFLPPSLPPLPLSSTPKPPPARALSLLFPCAQMLACLRAMLEGGGGTAGLARIIRVRARLGIDPAGPGGAAPSSGFRVGPPAPPRRRFG